MSALSNKLDSEVVRLTAFSEKLSNHAFELHNAGRLTEEFDVINANGSLKDKIRELSNLSGNIKYAEGRSEQAAKDALERYERSAKAQLRVAAKLEATAKAAFEDTKLSKPARKVEEDEEEEKPKAAPKPKPKPAPKPKPPKFSDIPKKIDEAVIKFNKSIPGIQRGMFDALMEEVAKLDLQPNGDIKATVANIKRVASIKNKLLRLILTDQYNAEVKQFAQAFNEVTKLQNDYWRTVEKEFKPRALLKEIRRQAVADVVRGLTETGLAANVAEPISEILKRNITTGGSIKNLTKQLRESLVNTETPGTLERYAKTYTQTSINQYSASYSNTVSSDLGFEWYRYANSLIVTSRPFCQSLREENQYFHVSMIPSLLKAEGLYYTDDDGVRKPVPINKKTGLPDGFIAGTDASNFLINRGGWNCGHQAQPISEGLVPADVKAKIMQRADYQRWVRANSPIAA